MRLIRETSKCAILWYRLGLILLDQDFRTFVSIEGAETSSSFGRQGEGNEGNSLGSGVNLPRLN